LLFSVVKNRKNKLARSSVVVVVEDLSAASACYRVIRVRRTSSRVTKRTSLQPIEAARYQTMASNPSEKMMRSGLLLVLVTTLVGAQTPDSLFRVGKFDEARAVHQALLARDKNDLNSMYWMGRISEATDKFDDAIDWFEKCVKRDDNSALYHFWLGASIGGMVESASKLRQPFLAKKLKNEFERAVALDPKMIDARQGLIDFYSGAPGFMGGSMEKAQAQVVEIAKLNTYRGHAAAARLAQKKKDLAGEEKAYLAGMAEAPDSLGSYWNLAAFYRRQSKWDESFGVYEKIMKVAPNEIVAHLGWGAVSALSGKSLDRGERELKTFLSTATLDKQGMNNLAGAHFRLGMIYEKTARKDLAKASYNETLTINPKHADAKKALEALK
jgi:tetratricopeptide (TPR) repeat protein